MFTSQQVTQVVNTLAQHASPSQKATLRLANGHEYTVVIAEVASRSSFLAEVFHENGIAGSRRDDEDDGDSKAITDLDLPANDKFQHLYLFLMTGAQYCFALRDVSCRFWGLSNLTVEHFILCSEIKDVEKGVGGTWSKTAVLGEKFVRCGYRGGQ